MTNVMIGPGPGGDLGNLSDADRKSLQAFGDCMRDKAPKPGTDGKLPDPADAKAAMDSAYDSCKTNLSDTLQKKFDDKYGLGFPLLSDEDHKVAEAWGVWGEKTLYGRKFMGIVRSAFVVDDKGKLKGVFYKVSPKDTVPKAEAVLKE